MKVLARAFGILVLATFASGAIAADPQPTLPELLKEYRALGLPFPPKDAKLVRYWYPGGKNLGEGKIAPPSERLAFEIKPSTNKEKSALWSMFDTESGFYFGANWDPRPQEVKPDREAIKNIDDDSNTYLYLAIQCHERGWDELAKALLEKMQAQLEAEKKSVPSYVKVEQSPKKILERDAWWYHYRHCTHPTADRNPTAKYLSVLISRDKNWEHLRPLLKSLDLANVPSKAKPGSVEALIDSLVDYNSDTFWKDPVGNYRKLVELGFDAIPALIEHLGDDRLTRADMHGYNDPIFVILRIGDLVGDLLEGFAGDDLMLGMGEVGRVRLQGQQDLVKKKAIVLKWWEEVQKIGEEKYILDRILPKPIKDKRQLSINRYLLQTVAAKYPTRIPTLYKTVIEERQDVDSRKLAEALLAGKTPPDEKLGLFLATAKFAGTHHQIHAFYAIKELDQKVFDTQILTAIQELPKDVKTAYYWRPEPIFAQLAIETKDPQVWEALEKTIRRSSLGLRTEYLEMLSNPKEPRWRIERLKLLTAFLDDTEVLNRESDELLSRPTGNSYPDNISVKDFVTGELARMLKMERTRKYNQTPEEWARISEQVRAAVQRELEKKEPK
jgi:hypothetical protein